MTYVRHKRGGIGIPVDGDTRRLFIAGKAWEAVIGWATSEVDVVDGDPPDHLWARYCAWRLTQ